MSPLSIALSDIDNELSEGEGTEEEEYCQTPFTSLQKYEEKQKLFRKTFQPWRTENNKYKNSYKRVEHQESLGEKKQDILIWL